MPAVNSSSGGLGAVQEGKILCNFFVVCLNSPKALLCRMDAPQPQERRRRGETDKGAVAAWRTVLRRVAKTGAAVARGRYAALREAQEAIAPEPITSADAYASAGMYLSDNTLDWLNLWQANADNDCWHEEEFSAKQDQNFPQP